MGGRMETHVESSHFFAFDLDIPLEVGQHLALHLVHLRERKKMLTDDRPRLVRVGVVAELHP